MLESASGVIRRAPLDVEGVVGMGRCVERDIAECGCSSVSNLEKVSICNYLENCGSRIANSREGVTSPWFRTSHKRRSKVGREYSRRRNMHHRKMRVVVYLCGVWTRCACINVTIIGYDNLLVLVTVTVEEDAWGRDVM
jgi:hypothetical protein